MENDTTLAKEGLLEPVLPGSVTFKNSILLPLQNNYLYEESKECFTYSFANLINNTNLQGKYSAFRTEKQEKGYSEEELEECFGFLLFDDYSRANTVAETGLKVGQGTCTTLGDSSKGVYISKYSDCLDLKRWYDGKSGYIVILKLTKGRVKEVTENYTQNFTPPTTGFDCHVSEQLGAVCTTTSSFVAFERTQYYMYEQLNGESKVEQCPRHVCPFAIVAFSYGKTSTSLELKQKSQEKTSFHYQPWSGQLQIQSVFYDVGLKSVHGAIIPADLPKTIKIDLAIGVSELRKTLPQAIFESSFVGEVSLDSCCFSLYDVVSCEGSNDLSLLTHELKEKDLALVVSLQDGGFLVLLHSSHFFSYEGAGSSKASGLQCMFIFPNSRTVPRETKTGHTKPNISLEVLQVLPALNYAESEMEKCPLNQQGEPIGTVEKHLQNFATLILPGLSSSPVREASMFPDQYDIPDGFPLVGPKWTEETGSRLKTYLEHPSSFRIPVKRALELLAAGKQQRNDDDHDDDVFYYISSPEAPQTPADMTLELDVTDEADKSSNNNVSDDVTSTGKQQTEQQKDIAVELSHSALPEDVPGTVAVAASDNHLDRTDPSPKSGDLPIENCIIAAADIEKTSENILVNAECNKGSKEPPIETSSVALTDSGNNVSCVAAKESQHSEAKTESDSKKEDSQSNVPAVDEGLIPDLGKEVPKETGLPFISVPSTLENNTENVEPQTNSDVLPETKSKLRRVSRHRGKRKRRVLKRNLNEVNKTATSDPDTTLLTSSSVDATPEQSGNSETLNSSTSELPQKNWRSLPRRKKLWNADVNKKRVLRSDNKSSETESVAEKSQLNKEPGENIVTSTPKRKMEGFSMRERYGLKTIITECGRVFVPHGSEATEDIMPLKITKESQDTSLVTTTSTVKESTSALLEMEKNGQRMPLTHIQDIPMDTAKESSSQQMTGKDAVSHQNSDSLNTDPRKGKKSKVYKAISISKLKTVLKRAKSSKSPGTKNNDIVSSDSAEPDLKKSRPNTEVDLTLDNKKLSCHASLKDKSTSVLQNNPELFEGKELPDKQFKQTPVSWRELKTSSSQEKLMLKENGCINIEIFKQAHQQPVSALTGDWVEGKTISSEGISSKMALAAVAPLPSDALTLLADLALSANSHKILPNPAKTRQETHVGLKTSSLPESALHALLRLKLPPKSPFPEGLVVPVDFMLEISKEHSYSQPTSLLPGLTRAFPQDPPPAGCVESLLSLNPRLHLKLPDPSSGKVSQEKEGKNDRHLRLSSDVLPTSALKPKIKRPNFFRHRHIIEKGRSIQVSRLWSENYDFRFDSRFTNDKLEKSVTRALHGNWDFSIQDTFEQVHLIFHMWIGLFYSKPTSRFFHFDNSSSLLERKDLPKVSERICPVQAAPSMPDVELSSKEDKTTSLNPVSDVLDLSVKISGPSDDCKESEGKGDNPPSNTEIRSRVEHTTEKKEADTQVSLRRSPSVPTKLHFMDYRPTVCPSEETIADDDNCSDLENDTVTESSYTKLLENNSAYSHLCEQASNMHIDKSKSLTAQKSVIVCKGTGMPEALRMKSTEKIASSPITSFDPKAIGVFHQVVRLARPVILSKTNDQDSERKIMLNSLSFKDKPGDRSPVLKHTENVPKDESGAALIDTSSTQVYVDCSVKKDEIACKSLEESSSSSSVAVCNENDKMEDKSGLDTRSDTSMGIQSVIDSTNTNVKSVPDVREDTSIIPVHNVTDDISIDVHDVTDKAEDEIKPVRVDKATQNGEKEILERIHADKTTEHVGVIHDARNETYVLDVRDEMSMHDMKIEGEVKPIHDVRDGTIVDVQDVHDNTEDGVKDDTPVNIQDVNETREETKLDVRDCTSVIEHLESRTEVKAAQEVINASATKEQMLENDEKNTCEEIKLSDESKLRKGAELICSSINCEEDSEKHENVAESHVSALEKESTDNVSVKICDNMLPQDDNQRTVNEVPVLCEGDEQITEQTSCSSINMHEAVKLHEGETRTETSVVDICKEQISDVAQPEMAKDSLADLVSMNAHQFMKLKKDHNSSADDGICLASENKSELTMPDHSPEVQTDTSDVSPVDMNPQPHDINESSHWDIAKAVNTETLHASGVSTLKVDSIKVPELEEEVTDQEVSTICKMSAAKTSGTSHGFDIEDVSPPALQIDTESEFNSRSCTPTQDELSYSHETCEDLLNQEVVNVQDNQNLERELFLKKSPTVFAPDRFLTPPTSSETHRGQSFPQGTSCSIRDYDATVKVTDRSKSLLSEYMPKQKLRHFEHEAIPPPRDAFFKEGQLQKDQFGHLFEQYEEESSEQLSSRTHRSDFQTGRPVILRKSYARDEDSEDPLTVFGNSTSIHREDAQMPREPAEGDSDIPDWVQQFHYEDSVFSVDNSNKRGFPFRHKANLSESNDDFNRIHYSRKNPKRSIYREEWDEEDFGGTTSYNIRKTFSSGRGHTKPSRTITCSPYQRKGESKQSFDWRRYFRREIFDTNEENDRFVREPPSSIVTVFDQKGNRAIFENPSTQKRSVDTHGDSLNSEDSFHKWEDQRSKSDVTQSLMELEYLIFTEKMNHILKNSKPTSKAKAQHRPHLNPAENLMTIQFSRLDEQENSFQLDETFPTLAKFKINVDMSESKGVRRNLNYGKPLHLQSLFCERGNEATSSKISDITKECAKSYNIVMSDVCAGKSVSHQNARIKRKRDTESADGSKQAAVCGRIKKAMFNKLHDNLNSVVRQACKIKYNFYILVTSKDPFFEETKDLLEAEGHTAVEPYQFDIDDNGQTPLLIILRNEDIAEHICEVPLLLELKKSSRVMFAGIDQPDDVVNLTHQELFAKGGFVVFDGIALDTLSLDNMKKVVGIMEQLDKKGKWKWFLHYRDSRKLRENARCSPEAQAMKNFMDCCQEAGIVEVLPYHECDVISRDRPDYLRCLIHLQILNVSARFPVFITDTPAESFGENGILTMNIYTFSKLLSNDTCSIS